MATQEIVAGEYTPYESLLESFMEQGGQPEVVDAINEGMTMIHGLMDEGLVISGTGIIVDRSVVPGHLINDVDFYGSAIVNGKDYSMRYKEVIALVPGVTNVMGYIPGEDPQIKVFKATNRQKLDGLSRSQVIAQALPVSEKLPTALSKFIENFLKGKNLNYPKNNIPLQTLINTCLIDIIDYVGGIGDLTDFQD